MNNDVIQQIKNVFPDNPKRLYYKGTHQGGGSFFHI